MKTFFTYLVLLLFFFVLGKNLFLSPSDSAAGVRHEVENYTVLKNKLSLHLSKHYSIVDKSSKSGSDDLSSYDNDDNFSSAFNWNALAVVCLLANVLCLFCYLFWLFFKPTFYKWELLPVREEKYLLEQNFRI